MPRKNNRSKVKNKQSIPSGPVKTKRRYPNQRLAQETADYQMMINPGLELKTYKDIDGGWYLTRIKN